MYLRYIITSTPDTLLCCACIWKYWGGLNGKSSIDVCVKTKNLYMCVRIWNSSSWSISIVSPKIGLQISHDDDLCHIIFEDKYDVMESRDSHMFMTSKRNFCIEYNQHGLIIADGEDLTSMINGDQTAAIRVFQEFVEYLKNVKFI